MLHVVAELGRLDDLPGFAPQALHLLDTLVPAEFSAYNEVVPGEALRALALHPHDGPAVTADQQAQFARLSAQHPVITYMQQTADGQALRISDFLSQRQFRQLELYRDFYRTFGVEHQLSLALALQPPLLVGIALHRRHPPFSDREQALLELVRLHLARAYQLAAARAQVGQTLAAVERALETDGRGLILLSRFGQSALLTAQARRWLAAYFGPPLRRSAVLPDQVEAWVTQQRQRGTAENLPAVGLPLMVCTATHQLCLRFLPGHTAEQLEVILLTETAIGPAVPEEGTPQLTTREQDVLRLLATGKSDRAIAAELGISTSTVHKHVQHVLRKLAVESRTAAAAWAFAHGLLAL